MDVSETSAFQSSDRLASPVRCMSLSAMTSIGTRAQAGILHPYS